MTDAPREPTWQAIHIPPETDLTVTADAVQLADMAIMLAHAMTPGGMEPVALVNLSLCATDNRDERVSIDIEMTAGTLRRFINGLTAAAAELDKI